MAFFVEPCWGVVPVLTGPLQLLLTVLPAVLMALLGLIASLLKPRAMKTGLRLVWRLKVPLVAGTAGVVGVAWAAQALWPETLRPGSLWSKPVNLKTAGATDHDWPWFRGGPARTGATPEASGPNRGRVRWNWKESGAAVLSSPAVVGDRVYISTATMALLGGGSGEIVALDAFTGEVAWRAAPPGYRATFSSPVVAGQSLVCGEGLHFVRDARVICLDLRSGREGQVRWTHRTKSHVECTPVVFENRVYVGAGEDGYYCLELEPDEGGQARVVWHAPGERYIDAETSLAVGKNAAGRTFVYAGLGLGGKALCVLDADTGREVRRVAVNYPVFGPPALAEGRLLVGMGHGDFVHPASELGVEPAGGVWCFDLEKLSDPNADPLVWKYATPDTVLGAVAVVEGTAYFGSRDGVLHAVRVVDGVPTGRWNARAPIVTSPAVTESHVYVITDAGVLYGLDRDTLEPSWETRIGSRPLFISSPAVGDGHVYVGSQFDGLLCVGHKGQAVTPLWPGHLGTPGSGGNPLDSPLPDAATFHWQYPSDQMGETKEALVVAPPAALGSRVYVPLASTQLAGLACLPAGGSSEDTPLPHWIFRTQNPVVVSPALVGESVLFVDGRPGDGDRQLHCLNIHGNSLWSMSVSQDAGGSLSATDDTLYSQDALNVYRLDAVYVLDGQKQLTALSVAGGGLLWRRSLGRMSRAPTVAQGLLVAAIDDPPQLAVLDRPTGQVLWRAPLAGAPSTAPVVEQNIIYLGAGAGLEARSLVDGQPLANWRCEAAAVASELLIAKDRLVYVGRDGKLRIVDRQTGATVRVVHDATPGMSPTLARGTLIFAGPQALWKLPLEDLKATPAVWVETDWLGTATTSPIVHESHLYLGRAGWGLVRFGAGP